MSTYVGADWASKGWVAAELYDGELDVGFYPTIWNLWYDYEDDADQILVDVPIGLPDGDTRTCDEEARDFLEERWASVFSVPTRNAVYKDHICQAKAEQKSATGSSITNQSWAIVPRIREVDVFLRETDDAQAIIRESHPEVCFRALNGDESIETKSSDGGIEARRGTLESEPEITPEDCDRAVAILAEPSYARLAADDDVLDAIVLAVTAKRVAEGDYSYLPSNTETDEDPPTDNEGIPMEIVYPEP